MISLYMIVAANATISEPSKLYIIVWD